MPQFSVYQLKNFHLSLFTFSIIFNTVGKMGEKNIFRIISAVSVLVFLIVFLLNRGLLPKPETLPAFIPFLPKLNALLNGTCTVLLLFSAYFIRKKNILAHRRINIIAFALSSLFLVSYVTFHFFAEETKFPSHPPLRF